MRVRGGWGARDQLRARGVEKWMERRTRPSCGGDGPQKEAVGRSSVGQSQALELAVVFGTADLQEVLGPEE